MAAQINLASRSEPAELAASVFHRDKIRRLRQAVLQGHLLELGVGQPSLEGHDRSRVAAERVRRECIDPVKGKAGHLSDNDRLAGRRKPR